MIHNPSNKDVFRTINLNIAAPGAGNNLTIAAPANAISELVHLKFSLGTDANVADRLVRLEVYTGALSTVISASLIEQTASLAWNYMFQLGTPAFSSGDGVHHFMPIPSDFRLFEGWEWRILVLNLQAADTIASARIQYKLWIYEQ